MTAMRRQMPGAVSSILALLLWFFRHRPPREREPRKFSPAKFIQLATKGDFCWLYSVLREKVCPWPLASAKNQCQWGWSCLLGKLARAPQRTRAVVFSFVWEPRCSFPSFHPSFTCLPHDDPTLMEFLHGTQTTRTA